MATSDDATGPDREDDEEGLSLRLGSQSAEPQVDEQMPSIQPFFTLLEDSTSGTYHHPQVHYIFSDEDSDALIESIQRVERLRTEQQRKPTVPGRSSRSSSNAGTVSTLKQTIPQERYVVVDIATDGMSVTGARSLTADWQVLDATISNAPMLDSKVVYDEEEGDDQRKLMLKIMGIGEIGGTMGDLAIAGDSAGQEASIEDEVKAFALRMAELGKIVARAEKDVRSLDTEAQPFEARI